MRGVRPFLLLMLLVLFVPAPAQGQAAERLVVIKADGLSQDLVDDFIVQRDPETGKSVLPWIEHVFYRGGSRLANFYVRGTSLSGPSWSLLDTGQPLQIKGNVEFDRYTQHPYDYLNFIPFWLGNAARRRGDMWATSVLDDLRLPLLLDAYAYEARLQSFQLFQRGSRWMTLRQGLQNRFTSRTPKELFDEWQIGFDTRGIVAEQLERELIAGLDDPRLRYLDYYTTDFDHATHHNRDRATHLSALRELDALVGRVWTAIERSPLGPQTALVLVSDHGANTDASVYSQGFNLVDLLSAAEGGGHHVITKRRLLKDYSIKGIYPLVPVITTTSPSSTYLKGQQDEYPTALVDFDGNERASMHLRHSAFNVLHVLLSALQRRDLAPPLREAAAAHVLATIDAHRAAWTTTVREMEEELAALRTEMEPLRQRLLPPDDNRRRRRRQPGPPESAEMQEQRIRDIARVDAWTREDLEYSRYIAILRRLLALTPERLAQRVAVEAYIPPRAMGDRNTLHDLQHYVTGPAPGGLVLRSDGSLDAERSFTRVDYFALLTALRVRNNVQPGVSNRPVDMVTVRVPCRGFRPEDGDVRSDVCVWLNGGAETQALLLSRRDAVGRLQLRYLPVARLRAEPDGDLTFERRAWGRGLPLRLWEDPALDLPAGSDRAGWLGTWHSDDDWLAAVHRTHYSNGIIGLHEQLAPHRWAGLDPHAAELTEAERLRRRFRLRQRAIVEPDLLIMASDHWNFDVRGFNPGGNHGSFFRPSTHSTFMLAGGADTRIPRGLVVTRPYDSLSFVPTVLALTGRLDAGNEPDAALRAAGFRRFPGRVVTEIVGGAGDEGSAADEEELQADPRRASGSDGG